MNEFLPTFIIHQFTFLITSLFVIGLYSLGGVRIISNYIAIKYLLNNIILFFSCIFTCIHMLRLLYVVFNQYTLVTKVITTIVNKIIHISNLIF